MLQEYCFINNTYMPHHKMYGATLHPKHLAKEFEKKKNKCRTNISKHLT